MPVRALITAMSFTWALVYSCQGVLQVRCGLCGGALVGMSRMCCLCGCLAPLS